MKPFAQRWKKFAWIAALLFFFLANRGFRLLTRNWLELRKLQHQETQLQTSLEQRSRDLRQLSNNPDVLESRARKELDFIKKGEIEYRFNPPEPSPR